MSIAIIDYGAGNLRSVQKALEILGFISEITSDKNTISNSKGIILPGVGAFDPAIKELKSKGLFDLLKKEINSTKPFLGLCLGMQLLFGSSEEGKEKGFGTITGTVKRFKAGPLKIPHMGWNNIKTEKDSPIINNIIDNPQVYFVHSYYCEPTDNEDILTTTDYGVTFASSISKNNIFALQFHPEKSGETGLKILKNFGGLCK